MRQLEDVVKANFSGVALSQQMKYKSFKQVFVSCYKYHRALMNPTAAATLLHLVNILYLNVVWPVFSPLLFFS